MRVMTKGLLAAFAVMTAGAAPAMACGLGGCSPCAAVGPCAAGWGYGRLAEPTTQYYYVNQGPTYSGPGSFAPYPAYEQSALPSYGYRHHYRSWHHGYAPRHTAYRHHRYY